MKRSVQSHKRILNRSESLEGDARPFGVGATEEGVVDASLVDAASLDQREASTVIDEAAVVQKTAEVTGPAEAGEVVSSDQKTAAKEGNFFSKEAQGGSTLNYFHLFWIFVIASVIGLVLETIYHFIVFGGLESRVGLVWGPFSPIYGCGAVLFTLVNQGKKIERKSKAIITVFLTCALVGTVFEFAASWIMQTIFGVVAWDYSNEFLNIGGRTSLLFSVMWGLLGTAWICWFLPAILKLIDTIPATKNAVVTILLSLFMLFNILATVLAIDRANERSQGIPEQTILDVFLDSVYTDEFIADRFENATILPDE